MKPHQTEYTPVLVGPRSSTGAHYVVRLLYTDTHCLVYEHDSQEIYSHNCKRIVSEDFCEDFADDTFVGGKFAYTILHPNLGKLYQGLFIDILGTGPCNVESHLYVVTSLVGII